MRNPVSLFKQYCRLTDVSSRRSRFPAGLRLLLFAGLTATVAPLALDAAAGPDIPLPGTAAPGLARLFTPRQAPEGTYQVNALSEGIESAVGRVRDALPAGFRLGN